MVFHAERHGKRTNTSNQTAFGCCRGWPWVTYSSGRGSTEEMDTTSNANAPLICSTTGVTRDCLSMCGGDVDLNDIDMAQASTASPFTAQSRPYMV